MPTIRMQRTDSNGTLPLNVTPVASVAGQYIQTARSTRLARLPLQLVIQRAHERLGGTFIPSRLSPEAHCPRRRYSRRTVDAAQEEGGHRAQVLLTSRT